MQLLLGGVPSARPSPGSLEAAREVVRAALSEFAAELNRPAHAWLSDPEGAWPVIVEPDGTLRPDQAPGPHPERPPLSVMPAPVEEHDSLAVADIDAAEVAPTWVPARPRARRRPSGRTRRAPTQEPVNEIPPTAAPAPSTASSRGRKLASTAAAVGLVFASGSAVALLASPGAARTEPVALVPRIATVSVTTPAAIAQGERTKARARAAKHRPRDRPRTMQRPARRASPPAVARATPTYVASPPVAAKPAVAPRAVAAAATPKPAAATRAHGRPQVACKEFGPC